ncbi:MAG: hypothetical protein B7Y56_00275 [Gallionellales bacterium 35-53-114]|jgi:hypothetical protein|nr:MAG: hypothetical protein B7Y56_00275 [Gallionellales bacterium 35-53-114]OYZ62272.1 MAG: hypothetical protein B7Y04_14905 [Gallionellales bacterium 24-53-125]OZB10605.1 MAG: hypothetical protein B7X61_03635 [Gallionellales bacterium 39-52-133]HQS57238.1 hypothetical protein [Gallionellaceae bacterium]HQS74574.1 hypothetical protein [Gallionellaceae bacterium]
MSENIGEIKDGLSESERLALQKHLEEKLLELGSAQGITPLARARMQLDIAEILNNLERKTEAWDFARDAFDAALNNDAWQDAVEACNVLYQSEQDYSIAALGMGVWLAVSFPVDPELTLAMLLHIVDETPPNSDGAALAAVTARYVIDLRASDDVHESQGFLANNLIAMVAGRHSNVRDQAALDKWLDRLELRNPQIFLPRLGQVVDAIVGDAWWFERDELRKKFD